MTAARTARGIAHDNSQRHGLGRSSIERNAVGPTSGGDSATAYRPRVGSARLVGHRCRYALSFERRGERRRNARVGPDNWRCTDLQREVVQEETRLKRRVFSALHEETD